MAKAKAKGFRISNLETDDQKVQSGTWIDFGAGARIKIAKVGNDNYTRVMRRLGKPIVRQARLGEESEEDNLRPIFIKVVARTILLDWENILDDNGVIVEYSIQQAEQFLTDLPEFYDLVMEAAQDVTNFKPDPEEDEAGNSDSA